MVGKFLSVYNPSFSSHYQKKKTLLLFSFFFSLSFYVRVEAPLLLFCFFFSLIVSFAYSLRDFSLPLNYGSERNYAQQQQQSVVFFGFL